MSSDWLMKRGVASLDGLPDASEKCRRAIAAHRLRARPGLQGAVCTLILSKTGIKLGLVGGATLP